MGHKIRRAMLRQRLFRSAPRLGRVGQGSGTASITLAMNGLTLDTPLGVNVARPGDHASISVTPPDGVTFTSQAWGVGTFGDTTYGTGSSPTTYTASHGELLRWEGVGDDGKTYRASAQILYALPSFSAQPTITGTLTSGQTLTLTEGIAGPAATLAIDRFTLDGVEKSGELVGLDWDTTGEPGGEIQYRVAAQNLRGLTLSNLITATLQDAPVTPAVITIVSAEQVGDNLEVWYTIDRDDPTVEIVLFDAAEPNPAAADFGGANPTYVDQGTGNLTTPGGQLDADLVGTWNGQTKIALLPTGGGDSDVVVSGAFSLVVAGAATDNLAAGPGSIVINALAPLGIDLTAQAGPESIIIVEAA